MTLWRGNSREDWKDLRSSGGLMMECVYYQFIDGQDAELSACFNKLPSSGIASGSTFAKASAADGIVVNTTIALNTAVASSTTFENIGSTTLGLYSGALQVGTVNIPSLNLPTAAVPAVITLNPSLADPQALTFETAFFTGSAAQPVTVGKPLAAGTTVADLQTALNEISFSTSLSPINVGNLFRESYFQGVLEETLANPQIMAVNFTNNFVAPLSVSAINGILSSSIDGKTVIQIGTITALTDATIAVGATKQVNVTFTPTATVFKQWYDAIAAFDVTTRTFPSTFRLSISGTVKATIGSLTPALGAPVQFTYKQDIPTRYQTYNNSLCGNKPYDFKMFNCANSTFSVLCDLNIPSCGLECYNPTTHVCNNGLYLCPVEAPLSCPSVDGTKWSCYKQTPDNQLQCINGVLDDVFTSTYTIPVTVPQTGTATFYYPTTIATYTSKNPIYTSTLTAGVTVGYSTYVSTKLGSYTVTSTSTISVPTSTGTTSTVTSSVAETTFTTFTGSVVPTAH
ncbi:hypothetical protein HDU76_003236 [Blyttiomyces sp. JEL0837]|nr:hypothetical protein HDU76_003236 [Blyttiomyces sp. JEL0837]